MSDYGRRQRPATISDPPAWARGEAKTLPGGSAEADRRWAQNRIANFFRANATASSSVMRKADGGADAGHVPRPDEPLEKEPEAVANQAPDHARGDVDVGGHATGPTHQAPAIGAKLQSGVVSLSRKGEPQTAQPEERKGNPGGVQPAPDTLPGFPGAQRTKARTFVQGGGGKRARWILPDGGILEWDSRHGAVEKYNKRGIHLGEFDPNTGAQTKPADKTRKVEP